MIRKACPRCAGDIYMERGIGYTDAVCIQCGWRREVTPEKAVASTAPAIAKAA